MLALLSVDENGQYLDGVRALKCLDCDKVFSAVVSNVERELLIPDFEQMAEQAGSMNADRFQTFFEEHRGHRLDTVL